ncbi:hypothetical protein SMACR_08942 [Sordaria macrospora]|uniref:WGS project CABT00000000 data, contig 2.70 n=2 Tax=Sordaria macrospora TaxID=5147 RepID=F7WB64_SORMK|nr:uncharacterized protein SMAC_08942 [Sordaria macrospora k-hell]KAA8631093.1 hypothetical protein SMACR_08942 [Sordaria macrospora]KAH7629322.1 hypothetical protein B0T09DRAFT_358293 [Sordaria sp. MPI-SDFR-AT-0083]WPJ63928.1 hypothetical protein SMAC4_08942 [Sordaria macrospora]CCC14356.1 unnamed protein product [Sordaria macrospora k-hell]
MPKKRAASPARSPVAKRTRTVPKKAAAPKSTALKPAASSSRRKTATVSRDSRPKERPLSPEDPPLPDRNTPGSVGSSVIPRSFAVYAEPKNDEPKPPARVKVSELQMPRAYFYPMRKEEDM